MEQYNTKNQLTNLNQKTNKLKTNQILKVQKFTKQIIIRLIILFIDFKKVIAFQCI